MSRQKTDKAGVNGAAKINAFCPINDWILAARLIRIPPEHFYSTEGKRALSTALKLGIYTIKNADGADDEA